MTDMITVLIVEDDALIRMDIADQLHDFGFEVLEAENAAKAVVCLTARPDVQVIFTDVDMPGKLDGLMLAHLVSDRWPPIKIIVTSGHRKGCVDDMPSGSRFFNKPYQPQAIASAMHEMMDG
jgi:CheY-like chemotaxis protein